MTTIWQSTWESLPWFIGTIALALLAFMWKWRESKRVEPTPVAPAVVETPAPVEAPAPRRPNEYLFTEHYFAERSGDNTDGEPWGIYKLNASKGKITKAKFWTDTPENAKLLMDWLEKTPEARP